MILRSGMLFTTYYFWIGFWVKSIFFYSSLRLIISPFNALFLLQWNNFIFISLGFFLLFKTYKAIHSISGVHSRYNLMHKHTASKATLKQIFLMFNNNKLTTTFLCFSFSENPFYREPKLHIMWVPSKHSLNHSTRIKVSEHVSNIVTLITLLFLLPLSFNTV